jgi:lipopolysaccharide export system protein LptA
MKFFIFLILSFLSFFQIWAQDPNKIQFSAASLKGVVENGVKHNLFSSANGKRVILTQGKTQVFCDEAKENTVTKDVVATGNIIIKDKKMTIKGDKLFYHKTKGEVEIKGTNRKVVMEDGDMKLVTDVLYYNMSTKNARYVTGGVVTQKSMKLTSLKGYLYNNKNMVAFKTRVVMDDTVKRQHLETDTLTYFTDTKIAKFHKRTKITTKEGEVEANEGEFDNNSNTSHMIGNAIVMNKDYYMTCEEIINSKNENTIAKKQVRLTSLKDKVTIFADEMQYKQTAHNTKAYGNALMQKPLGKGDTLFLAADTLYSKHDSLKKETTLYAYHQVKIHSIQMQAKCDSLVYQYSDSVIHFFHDPILWSSGSQMTGTKIKATLVNNTIDKLHLDENAFILSLDSLNNFNQIKGNKLVANFEKGEIKTVNVDGSGQTIYYALTDDKKGLIGVNKILCAKMTMFFAEKNQLSDMSFDGEPDSKFIPPHEIKEPEVRLSGFKNRFGEIPAKEIITSVRKKSS